MNRVINAFDLQYWCRYICKHILKGQRRSPEYEGAKIYNVNDRYWKRGNKIIPMLFVGKLKKFVYVQMSDATVFIEMFYPRFEYIKNK